MLTERIIRDAKPGSKPIILWDSTVAGLGCKVFPTGRKSFVLSYRSGGRKRLATLARCSEISLRAAREKAGTELSRIRDGEADPLERRRQAREAPTVNDALAKFFNEFAPARMESGRLTKKTVAGLSKTGAPVRRAATRNASSGEGHTPRCRELCHEAGENAFAAQPDPRLPSADIHVGRALGLASAAHESGTGN